MDKLKELSVKLDGKIKQQHLINGSLGERSFKVLIVKDYRGYRIKISEYKSLYSIGIKINCDMSFSINKEDVVFSYDVPKQLSDLPYKIYVSNEAYNLVKDGIVEKFWRSFIPLLKTIGLSEYESIFLYKNGIYFNLDIQRDHVLILGDIIDFIKANESFFKSETKRSVYTKRIPENLRPLAPLLRKYSVSDDADRDELKEAMSRKQKLKLINLVDPFFDEIGAYLDSFKETPLSEEAMMIGELAELVSELKIRI